jgi:hypothetical protein
MKLENGDWGPADGVIGNFFLYAPLSEPERGEVNVIADAGVITNPYLDMLFPTGYAVYRDDKLLAYTDTRNYVDYEPLNGKHTYAIASLYRGNNESESISIEADYVYTGVEAVHSVAKLRKVVSDGMLMLPAYEGDLTVVDVMGRVVYQGHYSAAMPIALQDGIYVISTQYGAEKLIIN